MTHESCDGLFVGRRGQSSNVDSPRVSGGLCRRLRQRCALNQTCVTQRPTSASHQICVPSPGSPIPGYRSGGAELGSVVSGARRTSCGMTEVVSADWRWLPSPRLSPPPLASGRTSNCVRFRLRGGVRDLLCVRSRRPLLRLRLRLRLRRRPFSRPRRRDLLSAEPSRSRDRRLRRSLALSFSSLPSPVGAASMPPPASSTGRSM